MLLGIFVAAGVIMWVKHCNHQARKNTSYAEGYYNVGARLLGLGILIALCVAFPILIPIIIILALIRSANEE